MFMLKWDSISQWGRRAPVNGAGAPVPSIRDPILEAAIAHEQVNLLYQPLIHLETGRVDGAEALVRSPVCPSAELLFARAHSSGLGERLSRMIQRKALRSAAVWEGELKALYVSINLLPADISREGYEDWLLEEIGAAGLDPSRVVVEITESALLVDHPAVAERLSRLRDAGIRIAVDDFGTGYASLAYLTSLPLDMLKIDGGLVAGIVGGERDRIVVHAMIRLARELGLTVVVEGVESLGQLELLGEWGCELYQGFFGAGALTHEELTRFVASAGLQAA
jgi:EAL domain-containing protein (putative c-di-GMP-specific phosphodiesterase class I)